MDTGALQQRLKHGDSAAFQELLSRYQHRVINTCYGFVRQREDAEDIAQEVFLEVYQSIQKFRGGAKLSTWIYRISVTKSLDFIRKKNRKKRFGTLRNILARDAEIERIPAPTNDNPEHIVAQQERARMLKEAVEALPKNQQIAMTLHKYEGFSYKEVAEIMSTSVSSVESLIHRAKKNLQKKLFQYYDRQER
jgi:RNA polymerase sigma-70 factor (ECF subfamily)